VPEAPVTRREGKAGGIPVRHWTNEGPVKAGDFAPAVAPEKSAALGKHLGELGGPRARIAADPAWGFGKETEASDDVRVGRRHPPGGRSPPGSGEMIRKNGCAIACPNWRGVYTDAIRRESRSWREVVRSFPAIGPSGKSRAPNRRRVLPDTAFMTAVLGKVVVEPSSRWRDARWKSCTPSCSVAPS